MKIDELRAFCAVVDTGSFSKAAERLYVTQPTISKYIAHIEGELGCRLLLRKARKMIPTELGDKVYLYGKRMVEGWEKIQQEAESADLREQTELRIGYTYGKMLPFVSKALLGTQFSHQEVNLVLQYGEGETLCRLIQNQKLDCAVMHLPSFPGVPTQEARMICASRLALLVPNEHSLFGQKEVTLAQLSRETDVRPKRERRFYEIQDRFFIEMGLKPMNHIYVESAEDTETVSKYYRCIRLIPDIYLADEGAGVLSISDRQMEWPLVLISNKEQKIKAVEDFYKAMCSIFEEKERSSNHLGVS